MVDYEDLKKIIDGITDGVLSSVADKANDEFENKWLPGMENPIADCLDARYRKTLNEEDRASVIEIFRATFISAFIAGHIQSSSERPIPKDEVQ